MNFVALDSRKATQRIRVFDSTSFDLDGVFQTKGTTILGVEIQIVDEFQNNYELVSAHICSGILKNNDTFYYLVINLIESKNPNNKSVKVRFGENNKIQFNSGDLLYNHIHLYNDSTHEIKDCNFSIFTTKFNPQEINGNIIVGMP